MTNPAITILMAAHDGMAMLDAAIRSIRNQTFADWELVLIDDASREDLGAFVARYADPRMRVARNAANLGLAASLNRGIELATAPYIARMDADDVCYPERLAKQYEYLQKHPHVDVVGARALVFREGGGAVGVITAADTHEAICGSRLAGAFALYHPTWMGKTEWFRRHKYDPAFRKAQDYELLLRAADSSSYANVPEILLGYRADRSNIRKRLQTRRYVLMALAKNRHARNGRLDLLRGAVITCAKGAGDVVFALARTTMSEKFRYAQVPAQALQRWQEVWRSVAE
jgi:glycosyltransferase involved in cell wall biosynthesis